MANDADRTEPRPDESLLDDPEPELSPQGEVIEVEEVEPGEPGEEVDQLDQLDQLDQEAEPEVEVDPVDEVDELDEDLELEVQEAEVVEPGEASDDESDAEMWDDDDYELVEDVDEDEQAGEGEVEVGEPAATSNLQDRWLEVQIGFVDEPERAVADADQLLAEVIDELTRTLASEQERMQAQWHAGGDTSTEDLRQTFRGYRALFERVLVALTV